MKAIIISVFGNEHSKQVTQRAVDSCIEYGYDYFVLEATTPYTLSDNWKEMPVDKNWHNLQVKKYGKAVKANELVKKAATVSHIRARAMVSEPTLILEQDAIIQGELPDSLPYNTHIINLARKPAATMGYYCNKETAKQYNDYYDTMKYFVGHDSVHPYLTHLRYHIGSNYIIGGNKPEDSQFARIRQDKTLW